jgi:hypothetical protein
MSLPEDKVLLCLRPLCGIPEAGLHWFITIVTHHRDALQIRSSRGDKCLLYRMDGDEISVGILQVDNSFGIGTDKFLEDEERYGNTTASFHKIVW